jgi:Holliday junction resolvasome RuvABC endonuclease subunit
MERREIMIKLNVKIAKEIENPLAKVTKLNLFVPDDFKVSYGLYIGIDPGTVNMGVAYIDNTYFNANMMMYQIHLKRNADPVQRIINIRWLLTELGIINNVKTDVVIEGASYGDRFRQVELAEIRAAAVWWAHTSGANSITIASPSSIRKDVFGDGRKKAHEYWSELKEYPDALAALSCALYAEKNSFTKTIFTTSE